MLERTRFRRVAWRWMTIICLSVLPIWIIGLLFFCYPPLVWAAQEVDLEVKTESHLTAFPLPGEWPSAGRDGSLQNRTPLKGEITDPKVIWKEFTGVIETQFIVEPAKGKSEVTLPVTELTTEPDEINKQKWGKLPPLGLIGGKMQPIMDSSTDKYHDIDLVYADVLPDVPGLEKLDFSIIEGVVNGYYRGSRTGRLWAWQDGEWKLRWQLEEPWSTSEWHPTPRAGDFDGDDEIEVAYLRWYKIIILDARTGEHEETLVFRPTDCRQGRNYGYFGIHDINGDGIPEFVIQADFPKHVDVLGYKDGKLSLLWQRNILRDIIVQKKLQVVNPNPVADLDGDGSAEVVVITYNDEWENHWKVSLHDGMEGQIKGELLDEYLWGVVDLDDDGVFELLTQDMPLGSQPTTYGTIRVQSFKGGKLKRIWSKDNASWVMWDRPLPLNAAWMKGACPDRRDVLYKIIDGKANVVYKTPGKNGSEAVLSVASWKGRKFKVKTTVAGSNLEALGLDDKGNLLVKTYIAPNAKSEVLVTGGSINVLASYKKAYTNTLPLVAWHKDETLPLVAWDKDAKEPVVVVQSHHEQIYAFKPPKNGKSAKELWRVYGWGQLMTQGSVIADLNGDGKRQHIYATCAPSGCARIMVTDLAGNEIWHKDFKTIRGTRIRPNSDGMSDLIIWNVGHFTNRKRQDVIVTARRSIHTSEESSVISGIDGSLIWFRDRQDSIHYHRGIGGAPFGIGDYDGDGLDEINNPYWSHFHIMEGTLGDNVIFVCGDDRQLNGDPIERRVSDCLLSGDFENNGKTSFANARAVVRLDGKFAWLDNEGDEGVRSRPLCGDFDNDGKLELVIHFRNEGLKFLDSATGNLKWIMPEISGMGRTSVADIDSDGREELIMQSGSELVSIGIDPDNQKGSIEWKCLMPAGIGSRPVIADVDGSGKASILVVGGDGYLYCVR